LACKDKQTSQWTAGKFSLKQDLVCWGAPDAAQQGGGVDDKLYALEWLEAAGGDCEAPVRSEIVVAAGDWRRRRSRAHSQGGVPITWVDAQRLGVGDEGLPSLLLYFGDGPAYARLSGPGAADRGSLPSFQTADRALVEHLALRLQQELGLGAGPDAAPGGEP